MPLHRLFLLFVLFAMDLAAQAPANADALDALVKDSPFLPVAGASSAAAAGESGPLEFRSVIFENGEYAFSLYDQGTQKSAWVTVGQRDQPFVVRSFNRELDQLTVEHQGRSLVLELQRGRLTDQAAPGGGGPPPPLPTAQESSARAAGSHPNPVPPTQGVESQRLQALADEIRRRRQQQPVQVPTN